jgi:hypothetical protein
MLAVVWVTLALIASLQLFGLLTGRLPVVVAPMIGIVLGVLLSYGALGFEVSTGTGIVTSSEPELALVGLVVLVANSLFLFTDAVETLQAGSIFGAR